MITFLLQRNDHHIFGQNCKFVQHSATMQEKKGDVEKKLFFNERQLFFKQNAEVYSSGLHFEVKL